MTWGSKEHCAAIAALDQAAGNIFALPRYKVEAFAMGRGSNEETRAAAITDLGRRYAIGYGAAHYTDNFKKRLATAYVKGFTGQPCAHKSGYSRGGNWSRPLISAWEQGRRDRTNLNALMNARGDEA